MAKITSIIITLFLLTQNCFADQDCSKAAKLISSVKVLGVRSEDSQERISEAYNLCPNSLEIAYTYGNFLAEKGNFDEAMKVYSSSTDPSYALEIAKAILLTQTGKYDQASAILEKVIGEEPRKVEALQALSNLEFEQKNYTESERLIRLAIQEKTEDPALFYNLGITLEKLNRLDEARLALLTSNRLDSASALTNCALARVYIRQSNLVDALTSSEKAVSLAPQNYLSWLTNGLVHQQKQNHTQALDSFLKAEEINPNDFKIKLARAVSELNLGKNQSIQSLRELKKQNPDEVDISKALLWAFIYLKDYKSAINEIESIIPKLENDSIALNNLGILHKHLGKEAEAEKFFKRSIELNPGLKQAQKNLQLLTND